MLRLGNKVRGDSPEGAFRLGAPTPLTVQRWTSETQANSARSRDQYRDGSLHRDGNGQAKAEAQRLLLVEFVHRQKVALVCPEADAAPHWAGRKLRLFFGFASEFGQLGRTTAENSATY